MREWTREPIGKGLLHIQSDVDTGRESFTQWCNDVHHAEILRVPGICSVRRFERVPGYQYAAPNGATFLTVYQLDDLEVLESDAYRASARSATPVPAEVTGLRYLRTVYRSWYPSSGWLAPDGSVASSPQPVGTAILHVMMDVEAGWEDELNAWYAEEHLGRLLAVPGMLGARRFVATPWPQGGAETAAAGDGRHKYLAIYELVDPSVVESEEYAAAASMTPRTAQLAPHLAFFSQVYQQVFRASAASNWERQR